MKVKFYIPQCLPNGTGYSIYIYLFLSKILKIRTL